MATIAEIRAQYPQYADMPDAALADALHSKFYSDMPRAEFNAKVGLATSREAPPGQKAIELVRPTVEALGSIAGGTLGSAAAPGLGTIGGAALGYAGTKGALDLLEQGLGYKAAPPSFRAGVAGGVEDLYTGGVTEMVGRGIVGPTVNYLGKKAGGVIDAVRNLKTNTYLQAAEGRGYDILNALRGKTSQVPGAAPTAGEVAAPVGSTRFSALQEEAKRVPGITTEYADLAAQTNQARLAQEARAGKRFQTAADKLAAKITSGTTEVSQRETGEALIATAKSEQQSMKKGVIQPAYKAAFDAAGDAKVNVDSVVDDAEKILGKKLSSFDPSTAPATVRKLMSLRPPAPEPQALGVGKVTSKLRGAPQPRESAEVTLEDLDGVRQAINADIASATQSSDPAAATTLKNLRQLHSSIDAAINDSPAVPSQAKDLYKKAVDLYRTEYAPRFKTGVNADLFRKTSRNETVMNPDDVIKTYFQPNGEREAGQFVAMFGKNPQAMQTTRAGIEDLYRREVTDAVGGVTPAAHAAFLKKYAAPIRIMDAAGMNLGQRINIVGTDAARLARIEELAAASGNKLAPALPPGTNALAVNKRIDELTKGLSPQQLNDVNAVRADLLREGQYDALVRAGQGSTPINKIATKEGEKAGAPLPSLLSMPVTIFNTVYKKLALKMNDKLALEIAREMTSPALAADALDKALRTQAGRAVKGNALAEAGRIATIGGTTATISAQNRDKPVNNLAP